MSNSLDQLMPLLLESMTEIHASGKDPSEEVYNYLWTTDRLILERKYSRLKKVRDFKVIGRSKKAQKKRGQRSKLVGKCYEDLIKYLIKNSKVISYFKNLRSTTSEIDFLLKLEPFSVFIPTLKNAGTHILGEAKCYFTTPKKEWVDELRGIMETHSTSLSLLCVGCSPRKLEREVRVAIALHAAQDFYVVPFGIKQIEEIISGGNFLKMFSDQCVLARIHSSALHV